MKSPFNGIQFFLLRPSGFWLDPFFLPTPPLPHVVENVSARVYTEIFRKNGGITIHHT